MATGYLIKLVQVTLQTNYRELENVLKLLVWPYSDVRQIDKTLMYGILRATAREN